MVLPVCNFTKVEVMMSKGATLATIEECREVNRPIPKKRKCVEKKEIEDMTFAGLTGDQVRRLKDLLLKYRGRFTPKDTFPRTAKVTRSLQMDLQ